MDILSRATRGGVGAAIVGIGLAALALTAGWMTGAAFDGRIASAGCVGECASAASADSSGPVRPRLAANTPVPTPTEPPDFPFVSARSVAVIEGACGALVFGRDEHLKLPPASLTKMMTAAIATDRADLDMMITANVSGAEMYEETGSTIMGLEPGMELSLRDLLYGLMLPSGNDAAIAIAEGVAGSERAFVALMNEKARSLVLADTNFTNPHGLDEDGLYSSAYDMAILARYLMQNAEMREIVSTVEWQPLWDGPPIWNGNAFITQYEGADGVKIGYTEESRQTIVASAVRDGRRIIASLMRSNDRYTDAERLLDWAFEQPSPCP